VTPRRQGETQKAWVERVLRTDGRIATYDALYNAQYVNGGRFSITRLASVIWTLRHEQGWVIDETSLPGRLAEYRLVREGSARRASLPVDTSTWRCVRCGASAKREPEPMLGDMGRAPCDCGSQTFRRAA
jgi:hypothetical protein